MSPRNGQPAASRESVNPLRELFSGALPLLILALSALSVDAGPSALEPATDDTSARGRSELGRIVFVSRSSGTAQLWLVLDDGSGARRITASPGPKSHPQFTPDGEQVVYSSDHAGSHALYRIPVEGGEPELVYPGLVGSYGSGPNDLALSHGGNRLLVALRPGGVARLFQLELSRKELIPITESRLDTVSAAWAWDDTRIYMRRSRPFKGYTTEIWRSTPDGEDMRPLTFAATGSSQTGISIEPVEVRLDGRIQVAFLRYVALGDAALWLMDPDGSNPRPAPGSDRNLRHLASARCVPDEVIGSTRSEEGSAEIVRISLVDGKAREIVTGSVSSIDWWSPASTGACS